MNKKNTFVGTPVSLLICMHPNSHETNALAMFTVLDGPGSHQAIWIRFQGILWQLCHAYFIFSIRD